MVQGYLYKYSVPMSDRYNLDSALILIGYEFSIPRHTESIILYSSVSKLTFQDMLERNVTDH